MGRRKDTKGRRRAFGEDSYTETAEIPKARVENRAGRPRTSGSGRQPKGYVEGKARTIQWRPYKRLALNTFLYLRLTPEIEDEIRKYCNQQFVWRDGLMERLALEVSAWLSGKIDQLHHFGRFSNADSQTLRQTAFGPADGDQPVPSPGGQEAQVAPAEAGDSPAGASGGPDLQPAATRAPSEVVLNDRRYTILTEES